MSQPENTANNDDKILPYVFWNEMELGGLLGKGQFNDVYELKRIRIGPLPSASQKQQCARSRLAEGCGNQNTGYSQFAIKFLNSRLRTNPRMYRVATADLQRESRLLFAFDHPNIVKVHGIAAESISKKFIIMEKLENTLEQRIENWKGLDWALKDDTMFLAERLSVALQVSGALKYLHDMNIIFRDLKPANVGFDAGGYAKLFDFGLATQTDPSSKLEDGTYKLSGNVGSLMFMAPEVHLNDTYNTSADVYSFAMMLWMMMSLEKPFQGFTVRNFVQRVIQGGYRPEINSAGQCALGELIKRSWSPCITERPNMDETCGILKKITYNIQAAPSLVSSPEGLILIERTLSKPALTA